MAVLYSIVYLTFSQIAALEGHLCKTETQIDTLLSKLNNANDTIRSLQQEVSKLCVCAHISLLFKYIMFIAQYLNR